MAVVDVVTRNGMRDATRDIRKATVRRIGTPGDRFALRWAPVVGVALAGIALGVGAMTLWMATRR